MHPKSYLVLNKIFAGLILAIFLYSACYSPDNDAYPIRCIHEQVLGKQCPTCGMSHAFSALVRLQFSKADTLQPNALAVFSFFVIQLVLRIFAILLVKKTAAPIKPVIYTDIVVSIGLFLITFYQLINSTFFTFSQLLGLITAH
ncbi:MAG TPA: DUF2752 domain-containing protein [Bacteroidales bacterium]|nr:DUF2752 domain-containing protein [Bacteroidales bacterium]